tara:strand:- start:28282 stop:29322 length:1041 start_codon:yes stop_codon:yes gene_type:complete
MDGQFQKSERKIHGVEERSSEVHEIMGKAPHWVITVGTSVVFAIVILLLLGASYISYNDVIRSEIEITGMAPPVHMKIENGITTEILVAPGQKVKQGGALALLDTVVHFKDVVFLRGNMERYATGLSELDSLYGLFPAHLMLGKMQRDYTAFLKDYENYILLGQARENPKGPREKVRSKLAFQQLARSYQILLVELQQWDTQYVVRAPITGTVSYGAMEQKEDIQDQVDAVWLMMVPNRIEGMIGKIKLPESNYDRVKEGQKVMIGPLGYSYGEWGRLSGHISNITYVPNTVGEPYYLLTVKMDGLTTSNGKKLPFQDKMKGEAEIVVKESTVLQRLFYELQKLLE